MPSFPVRCVVPRFRLLPLAPAHRLRGALPLFVANCGCGLLFLSPLAWLACKDGTDCRRCRRRCLRLAR